MEPDQLLVVGAFGLAIMVVLSVLTAWIAYLLARKRQA